MYSGGTSRDRTNDDGNFGPADPNGLTLNSPPSTSGSNSVPPPSAPPPQQETTSTGAQTTTKTSITLPAITGIQNMLNPYGNLPRAYGTYRMRPPLAAQVKTVASSSVSYAMALFCLGYGPLDISDVKIGDKLVSQIPGAQIQILPGENMDTEKLTIFAADFKDLNVNAELKYNVQQKRTTPQQAIELQVDIQFPNGLCQFDANNNRSATTVQIKIEYSTDGVSWTNLPPVNGLSSDPALTVTDNTTAAFTKSATALVVKGSYQVRVTRLTADSTSTKLVNKTVWTTLRAFNDTPSYTNHLDRNGAKIPMAFIAVRVPASFMLNGDLPELNCIVKSKLNTSDGSTWTTSPTITNNPAWIFADILTGTMNKRPKAKSELDAAHLKQWADFCTTNGFTFNYVLDSKTTVQEALKLVASAGRALTFQNDGQFGVVWDTKQTTAVQHFSPRNSRSTTETGDYPEPPHAYVLKFTNKDSKPHDYQQDERVVYWDGYTVDGSNGTKVATLRRSDDLLGVTDSDQAWKIGRYVLASEYLRRRRVSITTDIEHLACQRFSLVRLRDDVLGFGLGQGIITAVNTDGSGNITSLTLDEELNLSDLSKTYGIWVRLSGLAEGHYQLVTTGLQATNNIILATPIPAATSPKPAVGQMVLFGEYGKEAAEMLVVGIEMADEKSAKITMFDHAPAIFDAVAGTIPSFESGVTAPQVQQELVETPVIASYRTDEQALLKDSDGSLQARIQLTMAPPATNTQYWEARTKLSTSSIWSAPQVIPVASGEIYLGPVIENQTYDVEVRALTYSSKRSLTPAELTGILVIGKQTPPPSPPSPTLQGNVLTWQYNATVLGQAVPLDLAGFRVKWISGSNPNWDIATVVADLVLSTQIDVASVLPKGLLTLMVKAVDTAGNESTAPAVLVHHFGSEVISNQLSVVAHEPDFTRGTYTNATIVSSQLQAVDDGGLMYGTDDNALFYQSDDSALMYQTNWQELAYEWAAVMDPQYFIGGVQAPELVLDYFQQAELPTVEYRTGGDSIFYDPLGDDLPFYGDDDGALMYDADPVYAPWPGRITASYDTYYFRMKCSSSRKTQGKIGPLHEILDAPNITEQFNDVSISAAGTRLSLTKIYRAIKNVNPQWQRLGNETGPLPYSASASDKSTSGPLIHVQDATGFSVSATIDATVQGY
jgi:predicted phage tail protein